MSARDPMKRLLLTLVTLLSPTLGWAQIVEFYHLDGLGSVRAVTDMSGAVVERHDYLPFGEEWCAGPPSGVCGSVTAGQPKRFTGKERDAETGLDYFGARYYGSKIGRFTTVDPVLDQKAALVNPQKWNRYAYGLNNPLRFVDPDGREGAELNQNRDILAFASGRMSLAEYNARIQARAAGALIGLAAVGAAMAPALAVEASIAAGRCGTSAACQDIVTGLAEGVSGAAPGSMGAVPTLTGTANRELFKEALGYVRASTGTAAQKANLFEALAGQITEKTAGSWSATRYAGAEGSNVFVGGAGETLVIDSSGALFRGRADTGLVAAGKNSFRPNFDALRKID